MNETEPRLSDLNRNEDKVTEMESSSGKIEETKVPSILRGNAMNVIVIISILSFFLLFNLTVTWSAYWPLYKMIQENDWKGVEAFVRDHPDALTDKISHGRTIFHVIVKYVRRDIHGAACLLEKLATKVHPKALSQKDHCDLTVLTICAMVDNTKASEILVKYDPDLPNIRSNKRLPIHDAAIYGHKDVVKFLMRVTAADNLKGKSGALLLSRLIQSNFYDVALHLLKKYPTIGRDHISSRTFVLEKLAEKPRAFASGNQLGPLQRLIYKCIAVEKENSSSIDQTNKNRSAGGDPENLIVRSESYSTKSTKFGSLRQITATFGAICPELHMMFWNALVLLVPCIKVLHEQKLTHMQTVEILRTICEGLIWNGPEILFLETSLHTAAEAGISEFVNEIIMAYYESVYWANAKGQHIFHIAVLRRQEKVYNLIDDFRFVRDMITWGDKSGNNMLHLAGRLVPSNKVAGAALQMQRELQWFKAVGNLVNAPLHEWKNLDNKTPREVFTESHKDLVKEGEKWMKDTASSCTVAVTLIFTVVFAAAFAVPGGNSNGGIPNFLNEQSFVIFAISDALALFSSTTSLLMFLGILTSRYSEEDFLVSLPRKLIIGLMTLFFSIASMMVAFGATIYLVLSHPWKWVIIPISLLGCVPVTIFALLQFPLLLEMILSTYGPSTLCGL